MKNVKLLISLIGYLKEFLPFENFKKFSEKDKEVYAFIRLYQKLGGEIIEVDGIMFIPESFEITLRLLNGERVVLKEKQKGIVLGVHSIRSREHIIAGITAASIPNEFFTKNFEEPYPGYGRVGFNTKIKGGNSKNPKQKEIRRR